MRSAYTHVTDSKHPYTHRTYILYISLSLSLSLSFSHTHTHTQTHTHKYIHERINKIIRQCHRVLSMITYHAHGCTLRMRMAHLQSRKAWLHAQHTRRCHRQQVQRPLLLIKHAHNVAACELECVCFMRACVHACVCVCVCACACKYMWCTCECALRHLPLASTCNCGYR